MTEDLMLSTTPDEKWSLAHLGQFCVNRFGKMAIDAWWIGKAMGIAKAKAGCKFQAWKSEHGFSDSMTSRYMRLCEAYKSPDLLEGKRIYPALDEAGILTRAPTSRGTEAAPLSESQTTDASHAGRPSWALPDNDVVDEMLGYMTDDGPITEPWPITEPCPATTLVEHIEMALPFAIGQLIQAIDKAITVDLNESVWSAAIVKSLKSQLADLRHKIDELDAKLSDESLAEARSHKTADCELVVLDELLPESMCDGDDHSLAV